MDIKAEAQRVMIAAGGTGGHVFPALALGEVLAGRGFATVFVTDRRGSNLGGAFADAGETHMVRASGMAGRGLRGAIGGPLNLLWGTLQARRLVRRLRPRAVVGFGGYPTIPPLLAAAIAGIPTLVHEANSVLGRANRWLAPHVRAIATSFADTAGVPARRRAAVRLTGNPVRKLFADVRATPYVPPEADGPLRLLVVGGSLGATILSRVVPAALSGLDGGLRARLEVVQQCRAEDLETVRAHYAEAGIEAELAPFFDDFAARLAAAHLVVSRAGASTVAELAVAGRPAILVPFAAAIDDHQMVNARTVTAAGGGWVIAEPGFEPAALGARIGELAAAPAALARAAAAIAAQGQVEAAANLADLVEALIAEAGR